MRMVLAIAALVSIAFGLIAVGRAWYEFRPLTDKERARLRQEGNQPSIVRKFVHSPTSRSHC
jgi:hypothetical protein